MQVGLTRTPEKGGKESCGLKLMLAFGNYTFIQIFGQLNNFI